MKARNGPGVTRMKARSMANDESLSRAHHPILHPGTRAKPLLQRAGMVAGARDVVFHASDRGFDCGVEHDYARSLTPEQALGDDVLLAWAMNGAALLPQHGFPLRLLVPGWYGMASVKWLTEISILDRPFRGHQQVTAYRLRQDEDEDGTPLTRIQPRSLMLPPGLPEFETRRRFVDA